jgi:hypothetical protein
VFAWGERWYFQQRFDEAEVESRSGYEILSKQSSAPEHWLEMARTDLVASYDALKQTDKSAKFRAELSRAPEKHMSKK